VKAGLVKSVAQTEMKALLEVLGITTDGVFSGGGGNAALWTPQAVSELSYANDCGGAWNFGGHTAGSGGIANSVTGSDWGLLTESVAFSEGSGDVPYLLGNGLDEGAGGGGFLMNSVGNFRITSAGHGVTTDDFTLVLVFSHHKGVQTGSPAGVIGFYQNSSTNLYANHASNAAQLRLYSNNASAALMDAVIEGGLSYVILTRDACWLNGQKKTFTKNTSDFSGATVNIGESFDALLIELQAYDIAFGDAEHDEWHNDGQLTLYNGATS
jgi:hypothetical protein